MKKWKLIIAALAVLVVGSGALYTAFRPKANGNQTGNAAVSVRMKWFFAGTMAPWFVGTDRGFYKDAGFSVTVSPGGPDNNAVKLVAAGTDTFGVAGADEVLMAREKGVPVVAVAVLFKESPICFISKKSKGIASPAQWSGRTIEVSYGSNAEVQYRALCAKFSVRDAKEVPYAFSLAPFMDDKVDVSVAYRMDQVVTLQRRGIELDIITAKEHGINPYGDVIITTEETLRKDPDMVRRFVAATVKSFQWSTEHPEEAVVSLVGHAKELKQDNEVPVWKATIPFVLADGGTNGIGLMSRERWEETKAVLVKYGALKADVSEDAAFKNALSK